MPVAVNCSPKGLPVPFDVMARNLNRFWAHGVDAPAVVLETDIAELLPGQNISVLYISIAVEENLSLCTFRTM